MKSPWFAFATCLGLAPWVFDSALGLNLLSQIGIAIIACLSFNLLYGQGGMLSFGHAVYTGTGAYAAIHALRWMAQDGWALPVSAVPLIGGLASAAVAVLLGGVSTRRGGLPLAMITLGLGELVYAAAHMFEPVFGGEGGLSANRVLGGRSLGFSLGSHREVYALIATYTLVCAASMAALTQSPLGRVLAAVRDNPERAGFLGLDESRVRYRVFVWAAFFAGISGGLAALNFENVTPEVFSSHRSGTYVLFTFLGGAGFFFGPVVGAVLMVLTQVLLSSYTSAWLLYLGLLFVAMVVLAPAGLASLPERFLQWRHTLGRNGEKAVDLWLPGVAFALVLLGVITWVEMGYHLQLDSVLGPDMELWGLTLSTDRAGYWWGAAAAMASGVALIALWRRNRRQRPGAGGTHFAADRAKPPADKVPLVTADVACAQAGQVHAAWPQTSDAGAPQDPPILHLRNISKRLGEARILQDISLKVMPGECLALIGPNGAGKSTLFNLISGRHRPTGGQITLGERRIDQLGPRQIHALGVGRSFQISHLFASLTVFENLRCAVLAHSGQGERLYNGARFRANLDERTHGLMCALFLQPQAQVQARHLSYAEQRALELGLALAANPPVLLLDEPTAGMSHAETRRALSLIRRLTRGKTVLIVEHDMSVVFDLADRIAVLDQGSLIACDTPQAVRANPQVQQAYLGQAFSLSQQRQAG